uniref:HTH psq-type domain-containing protein n=1 Tax=Nothobranchius furzeri TaxID=105023 RepID=A0A8C6LNN1_NOTFU
MAPKRSASAKAATEPKRKRKMMTIAEKVTLLDMLNEGRSYAAVARHFGVNESTVRYIKKDEVKIRKTASITFSKSAKRVVTARNKAIVSLEGALSIWIADCQKKQMPFDIIILQLDH